MRTWHTTLLLAGALACGPGEPVDPPTAETAPPVGAAETGASSAPTEVAEAGQARGGAAPAEAPDRPAISPAATPAPETSREAGAGTPEAPMPPLSDLLRLPEAKQGAGVDLEGAKEAPAESTAEDAGKKERRIDVDFKSMTDASAAQAEKSRTQTDAGVSIGVGEGTKVRGGVRVEQETGKEREQPVPNIGIEKRF